MLLIYTILSFCYIAISKWLYFLLKKFTENRFIKLSVILFFILLPTHDIILGNLFKYFYANFTTNEIIYNEIKKHDSIFIKTNSKIDSSYSFAVVYFDKFSAKEVQVFTEKDINEYICNNSKCTTKQINAIKPYDILIDEKEIEFPIIVRNYLKGKEIYIEDQNGNKIAYSRTFILYKKYSIDFFEINREKYLGGTRYANTLFEKLIK